MPEAEITMIQLQARAPQRLRATARSWKEWQGTLPWSLQREHGAADTLALTSSPEHWERARGCRLEPPVCGPVTAGLGDAHTWSGLGTARRGNKAQEPSNQVGSPRDSSPSLHRTADMEDPGVTSRTVKGPQTREVPSMGHLGQSSPVKPPDACSTAVITRARRTSYPS